MDEEDCYMKKEAQGSFHSKNLGSSPSFMTESEGLDSTEKHGDLGDMTFYMANYIKDAMKMMFIMRSHHMLTDVILEVESELFYAHKVILAAASPYFKVIHFKKYKYINKYKIIKQIENYIRLLYIF